MKTKKQFVCTECGYISPTWMGKCPECLKWNTFQEELIIKDKSNDSYNTSKEIKNREIQKIYEIDTVDSESIKTNNEDINQFFGNGLTKGSIILLAGEPGIGKSTFLLFMANNIKNENTILYFSGEESLHQIKKRTERVNLNHKNFFVSNETEVEAIIEKSKKIKPSFLFVDSIQTLYSKDIDSITGTVSQIKLCVEKLTNFGKQNNITIFIVGQITKSGDIAGPKIIEHMVDVVIYFDSNNQNQYRFIRSTKNRFGGVDEILLFEMEKHGLKLIDNPSLYFIDRDFDNSSIGKCKSVIIEGERPLIIEIEALVVPSFLGAPRRFAEGIDLNRVNKIVAILMKHIGENLNNYDIYTNISGGIKTRDLGMDLAIAAAIYSSKNKKTIRNDAVFIGELSLTGKVRNVVKLDKRIKEANKFGINNLFIPYNCDILKKEDNKNNFIKIENIEQGISRFYFEKEY